MLRRLRCHGSVADSQGSECGGKDQGIGAGKAVKSTLESECAKIPVVPLPQCCTSALMSLGDLDSCSNGPEECGTRVIAGIDLRN